MSDSTLPLGQHTGYPCQYQPDALFAIARSDSRTGFINGALPFDGIDIWNAWELTWLNAHGLPVVATAEILIPATSPKLIESKSLKLYLGSFAMSRYDKPAEVEALIATDLGQCVRTTIDVRIRQITDNGASATSDMPGHCLDSLAVSCDTWTVDASLLQINPGEHVTEDLHSHLLRSLCPVTAQPDIGSIGIRYQGPQIDHASLLQYIVSYREHDDFHEACVERIFVDILERCQPQRLSVYARFQRRGGIDINPFRSNFEDCPGNPRLWRQ